MISRIAKLAIGFAVLVAGPVLGIHGCVAPAPALADEVVTESEVTGELNQLSGEVSTLTGEVSATHDELGTALSEMSQQNAELGSGLDEKLSDLGKSVEDSTTQVSETLEAQGQTLEEIDSKAGQTLEAVKGLSEQEPQEVDDEWLRRSLTNIEQLLMLADACAGVVLGYLAFKRLWSSFLGR